MSSFPTKHLTMSEPASAYLEQYQCSSRAGQTIQRKYSQAALTKKKGYTMCLFTYIFHVCGHACYHFASQTTQSCSPYRPCQTPHLDNLGEDLIANSKVLASDCLTCSSSSSSSSSFNKDPYLTNLRGIADVFEMELLRLDYSTYEAFKALQAVKMLSRMAAVYDLCRESRPEREEMRRIVRMVVNIVNAAQTCSLRPREAVTAPNSSSGNRVVTPSSSNSSPPASPSSATSTNPYSDLSMGGLDFSEGTIERQLCLVRSQSSSGTDTQLICDMMNALHLSSPTDTNMRTSDEESIVTNPTELSATTGDVGEETKEEVYLGRDSWPCDFCGPVCLCYMFDD